MRRRSARRTTRRTARRTTRRVARRVRRRVRRRTMFVGGMMVLAASGTAAAIKLSKQDAQKIEQHTGLSPDQLEDQDLNQAMQELNIQSQSLSPEDQAALNQQNSQAPSQTSAGAEQPEYIAELEKLGELKSSGVISEEEFQAKKKQILGL